jgi:hypothetical protein
MRYGVEYNEKNEQQKENSCTAQSYVGKHAEINEFRAADPFYSRQPNNTHYTPDQFDDSK